MDSVARPENTPQRPLNRPAEAQPVTTVDAAEREQFDELLDRQSMADAAWADLPVAPTVPARPAEGLGPMHSSVAAVTERVGAAADCAERLAGWADTDLGATAPYRFDVLDSAAGIRSVQLHHTGDAGWALRLLAERWSEDALRRHTEELSTVLHERQHKLAAISLIEAED